MTDHTSLREKVAEALANFCHWGDGGGFKEAAADAAIAVMPKLSPASRAQCLRSLALHEDHMRLYQSTQGLDLITAARAELEALP